MHNSSIAENYLKCIFHLSADNKAVPLTSIAEALDVAVPTANSMVKKLSAQGWLKYAPYKPVVLTAKGRKTAALIVRRHRLTEMFLVQIMKFGWEEVHDIAEQIEHIHSPAFFDRIDELLGNPQHDPHGSPIPDSSGVITGNKYILLSDCSRGMQVRIKALHQPTQELLLFLNKKKLKLGDRIKVLDVTDFDGSMTIQYAGQQIGVFSKLVCDRLKVLPQ